VSLYRNVASAVCLAAVLLVLMPTGAAATVSGGCKVSGTASVSGTTDLTAADVWHLRSDDVVNGSATYPFQTFVHVYAFLFGIPIPVYSSSGKDTKGSAGPFTVSDYSRYTRVFAAGGGSDTCTGAVLIVVDDQNAFTNVAGLVGLVLAAIGVVGLLMLLFGGSGSGGCGSIFFGLLAGFLAGLGGALIAAETGLVEPRNIAGLVVIGVGAAVGALIPIVRSRMA
jgi:hypothetical protein